MTRKKFQMLEFLGVVSTVLGIFKGMLMDLPFQVWFVIVLSAFTIYWVGRDGRKKYEKLGEPQPLQQFRGAKHVVINV